jgi:PKD repeat protein
MPFKSVLRAALSVLVLASAATAQAVPELIYYKFNEGTGVGGTTTNHAIPSVGSPSVGVTGHSLTPAIGLLSTGALVGTTGTTNIINTGWQTAFGAASWTISFWCDVSTLPTTTLYYPFGDSTAGSFRCFFNGAAGVGNLLLRGGFTDVNVPAAGVGGPHVITFVYDSTVPAVYAYKDGILAVTSNQALNINGTALGSLKVAGYSSASTFGGGAILDEFRVYNRALSAAEVAATWNFELPVSGLYSQFTGSPTSGPAPLNVNFTDQSISTGGPVLSWAWDFDGDNIIDSVLQNPSHVYTCPGLYTVSLTTTDGIFPVSTLTKTNYINVGQFPFDLFSTGGGVGDLVITPVPTNCGAAAGSVQGFMLVSFATAGAVGSGPLFGLVPDALTWQCLTSPFAFGNPISFYVAPGFFPNTGPLAFPPGSLSGFAGQSMDGMMVFLTAGFGLVHSTPVDRVTF